ncbi:hypothetical protein [Xenorhabdus anantnagensis]|uniref:Phage protein n=1 Tax=Xenorhabdus anantnagensis TaxID=3025875 RepID=A0ABT5LWU2_9GAMM|nr:hypothetical protein [Xenorhabdus anantnagensis]MDC9598920.1 hypothetical protein [Xenorhabdus anantnagensis]
MRYYKQYPVMLEHYLDHPVWAVIAGYDDFSIFKMQTGDTPQIAICRAVVAAQLGDEVEIPDELEGV